MTEGFSPFIYDLFKATWNQNTPIWDASNPISSWYNVKNIDRKYQINFYTLSHRQYKPNYYNTTHKLN